MKHRSDQQSKTFATNYCIFGTYFGSTIVQFYGDQIGLFCDVTDVKEAKSSIGGVHWDQFSNHHIMLRISYDSLLEYIFRIIVGHSQFFEGVREILFALKTLPI